MWRSEHRFNPDGFTTYLFLSWQAYSDKLPEAGDVWEFENVHWARGGSFSWNGLKSIHGRSSWGELVFEIPPEALLAIKRERIFEALANYKQEKQTRHHYEGVLDHWNDPAVGDPAFYEARVKPLEERLDSYIERVNPEMGNADIEELYQHAVFGWNNLRHIVSELRREWLQERLTDE